MLRGCIVFQLQGKRVNFNHFCNQSDDPLDSLYLLENFYGLMSQRGVRAGFLWVNEANVRVVRLHRAFGWQFDGLQDHFYLKGRDGKPGDHPL